MTKDKGQRTNNLPSHGLPKFVVKLATFFLEPNPCEQRNAIELQSTGEIFLGGDFNAY